MNLFSKARKSEYKQDAHTEVSWGLHFKPLGLYPAQDINQKHFGAATASPHAKCHCNPTCHTSLRFQPSLSNHSRVLGIQPGKAGHAIRAKKERQPDRQRQLRGTFTVKETWRKETTYRHYIMAMCLFTQSIHTDSNTMVAVWLPKSVQLTETYGRLRERRGVQRITEGKEARRRAGSISVCQSMPGQTLFFTFNASIYSFRRDGLVRE